MVELSQQAQIRLQQMRDNYKQSLPAKKNELEAAWAVCMESEWTEESVAALKSLAHKLGGSAGLYGFSELGEAARALDGALFSAPRQVDKAGVQVVLALMVQLESQFSIELP
jgi:HPt (histidine-containing phosphotransfer) domain-containing protein